MAIFASSSTITTQTVPLITVDLAEVKSNYVLQWDAVLGSFVAKSSNPALIIDLADPSQIVGVLPVSSGGTGSSSYNNGDMLVATDTDGTTVLAAIPIGNGNREQLLTVVDGMPEWSNVENIKGITNNRITTTGGPIGNILPPNSIITKIKIVIETGFTDTTLTIGIEGALDSILGEDDTFMESVGIFVYDVNQYYLEPTQLIATLTGNNDGSLQIIVDYATI